MDIHQALSMQRIQPEQVDRQQESDRGRMNLKQGIVAKGRHDQAKGTRDQQSAQGDEKTAHPKIHPSSLMTCLDLILVHYLGHDDIPDQNQSAQSYSKHYSSCIGEGYIG